MSKPHKTEKELSDQDIVDLFNKNNERELLDSEDISSILESLDCKESNLTSKTYRQCDFLFDPSVFSEKEIEFIHALFSRLISVPVKSKIDQNSNFEITLDSMTHVKIDDFARSSESYSIFTLSDSEFDSEKILISHEGQESNLSLKHLNWMIQQFKLNEQFNFKFSNVIQNGKLPLGLFKSNSEIQTLITYYVSESDFEGLTHIVISNENLLSIIRKKTKC